MKSNLAYTLLLKYSFLLLTLATMGFGFVAYFNAEGIELNGRMTKLDPVGYVIMGAVALIWVWLHAAISTHVVRVKVGQDAIVLFHGSSEQAYSWSRVKHLTQYQFVYPPLYKLKLEDEEGYFIFTTEPTYFEAGLGVTDLSEMGKLIKNKKNEYKI